MDITFSINLAIVVFTVVTSIYAFQNAGLKYKFIFSPYQTIHQKKWYKLLTHAFIHADWMHLFFNMYVLFFFGKHVEEYFISSFGKIKGEVFYVLLYVGGIIFASLPSLVKHKDNDLYFSLGASGAVSAVMFSFIIIAPGQELYLLGGIPIKAYIFGPLYLLYEYLMSKHSKGRIAHDAHFAGAIFGIIFTLLLDFNFFINNFIAQVQALFN